MPLIVRGSCPSCGQRSAETSAELRSVRFNGEDDRVLPHPGEADTLREWGLDWQKLERADRMGRRVLTVCDRCSALAHRDADDGMLPQRVSRLVDGLPVLSGVIGANAESASSSAWRRAARAG